MILIFGMAVLAAIGGVAVQFDNDPSNNDAGWVLAGVGGLVAVLTGWAMWGGLLPPGAAAAAKLVFFGILTGFGLFAFLRHHVLLSISLLACAGVGIAGAANLIQRGAL